MTALVQGWCHDEFVAVRDAFAANFAARHELGAAVHVIVDGEAVVDLWGGHRDVDRRTAWTAETLVDVYSVGKPFGAVLLLRLVDEGRMALDDPVARHWPGFEQAGKASATVRQLLCHRLGLPAIREELTDTDLFDFDRMVTALERTAPWWPPGSRHAYHSNTFGHLCGGLFQRSTGTMPGSAIRTLFHDDLGADVHVGVPNRDLARCADIVWDGPAIPWSHADMQALDDEARMIALSYANPPGYSSMGVVNSTAWRQAQIVSTNTHASARGVAIVYGALLDGRLLGDDVLREATRVQSAGWCPVLEQEVAFGLGFQPWTEARPLGRTPASFGHFGTGGALGFADPSRRLAFGYVMNHVIPRWRSPRNQALVDAVYASLD